MSLPIHQHPRYTTRRDEPTIFGSVWLTREICACGAWRVIIYTGSDKESCDWFDPKNPN
jgi:hypothetical protein